MPKTSKKPRSSRQTAEMQLNARNTRDGWMANQIAELVTDSGILKIYQTTTPATVRRVFWLRDLDSHKLQDVLISMLPVDFADLDFPTGYTFNGMDIMYSPRNWLGYLVKEVRASDTAIDVYPAMVSPIPAFAMPQRT